MKTALVVLAIALLVVMWAGDRISLEGERTVYTVRCEGGTFEGTACSGKLAPAERVRFRALRNRNEVLYWIVESRQPSGKYSDCAIHDRGNWTCKVAGPEAPTITYQMVDDVPQRGTDPPTQPFSAVRKWKWWLMRMNVRLFRNADM